MGTIIEVISPDRRAADIAFKEIKRIESLLSLFKDNSQISRLNNLGSLEVDPDTLFVIKKAGEFWRATEGLFDITIAPLMKLWGFYDKDYRVPDDLQINQTLELIGFDKVKIDGNIIEFRVPGMMIDLGAIAKGYAIDCAAKQLRNCGIDSALLNAGGDIYCLGDKRGQPWRIAIKAANKSNFAGYLELIDKAVATSGDYEQYFSVDDVRYCHLLNPKTGKTVDSGINSVTVIADDCLTADALATGVFILGQEGIGELAERFNAQIKIYKK